MLGSALRSDRGRVPCWLHWSTVKCGACLLEAICFRGQDDSSLCRLGPDVRANFDPAWGVECSARDGEIFRPALKRECQCGPAFWTEVNMYSLATVLGAVAIDAELTREVNCINREH